MAPQQHFDPNQPITVMTLWPWILGAIGTCIAGVRVIIKRILKLEFEKPMKELKLNLDELKIEHFKIREALNDIKIQNARLEEAVDNLKRGEH